MIVYVCVSSLVVFIVFATHSFDAFVVIIYTSLLERNAIDLSGKSSLMIIYILLLQNALFKGFVCDTALKMEFVSICSSF